MKIDDGMRVRIKIKLSADGDVIEDSVAEYFQGSGTILPGLEKVLAGLEEGAKEVGTLASADAFGALKPQKTIARAEFPKEAKLEAGETFAAKGPDGTDVTFRVLEADDEKVQVELVHPLADKDLDYELEVLSVTDPKPPPLPGEAVGVDLEESTD